MAHAPAGCSSSGWFWIRHIMLFESAHAQCTDCCGVKHWARMTGRQKISSLYKFSFVRCWHERREVAEKAKTIRFYLFSVTK